MPKKPSVKATVAGKTINTVAEAVQAILKDVSNQDMDENNPSTPQTQDSETLKDVDSTKPVDMSWLRDDAKPLRTYSSMERVSPISTEDDWDRPKSEVTHGSHTVIPVTSSYAASGGESVESQEDLWKAEEACQRKSRLSGVKYFCGVPLIPRETSIRRVESNEGHAPLRSETVESPEEQWKAMEVGKSKNEIESSNNSKSPEELWKAVEACRAKSQKSLNDYSGVPLIPVEISIRRDGSNEGPFLSPPVSRCSGSMGGVSDVQTTDSDIDENNPESRDSSRMGDMSHKEPTPTPRPSSSRKLFFLKARPESQNLFDDRSSSINKPLIGCTAFEDDRSSTTSSKDIKTPTFGQYPESPERGRKSRKCFRLESRVSSLYLEGTESDLKDLTEFYIVLPFIKFLKV